MTDTLTQERLQKLRQIINKQVPNVHVEQVLAHTELMVTTRELLETFNQFVLACTDKVRKS